MVPTSFMNVDERSTMKWNANVACSMNIYYISYIYIRCVLTKKIVARHVATALYIRVTYRKWHMKSGEKRWNVTWVISYGISYVLCIQSYLQHHVTRACTKYEAKFVHPLKTGHILWWWARTNHDEPQFFWLTHVTVYIYIYMIYNIYSWNMQH